MDPISRLRSARCWPAQGQFQLPMHLRFSPFRWFSALLLAWGATARAQEFSAQFGTTGGAGLSLNSHYSWQMDYRHAINRDFAWSLAWINEGHEAEHHRDGVAGQFWYTLPFHARAFSLS